MTLPAGLQAPLRGPGAGRRSRRMQRSRHMGTMSNSTRDWRIDWLRGLALVSIFVNHMPGNRLENWTTRNFGFSDAAEVFVLLAGVAAAFAYFKRFEAGQQAETVLEGRAPRRHALWRAYRFDAGRHRPVRDRRVVYGEPRLSRPDRRRPLVRGALAGPRRHHDRRLSARLFQHSATLHRAAGGVAGLHVAGQA